MMELTRTQILAAFEALDNELRTRGVQGEICIFGGTAMILAYSARVSTKDVDALFQPTLEVRNAAERVAESLRLPDSWLNDGVKGFVSARHEVTAGNLPQYSNLHLTMPVPEYLLAMKALSGRIAHGPNEPDDIRDIKFLVQHLGLTSPEAVLAIVQRYYPAERISVKTQYLVDAIFER